MTYLTKRNALAGSALLAIAAMVGGTQYMATAQGDNVSVNRNITAPRFEVDPFWPKPMPDQWLLGQAIGVEVDNQDHIWIIHRGWDESVLDQTELAVPVSGSRAGQYVGERGRGAPPIIEFDQEGNVVQGWGGPSETGEYEWPSSNHGIAVDDEGFVYIGGNGSTDSQILKFTRDGQFVAQWGHAGARQVTAADGTTSLVRNSYDMESFGRVAKIDLDQAENEAYVADGYFNRRVAVLDMDTGEIKRMWGAYGNAPFDGDLGPYDPTAPVSEYFRNPVHCANISNDGYVYVCDRSNDRLQVFREDGTFVQEAIIAPWTRADGSVWDIDFSADPEQKYLYIADGVNDHIRVLDRMTLEELYNFGNVGRQAGQFLGVHSIAVDSHGNIYTTETYTGKRLQKHTFMGVQTGSVVNGQVAWGQ